MTVSPTRLSAEVAQWGTSGLSNRARHRALGKRESNLDQVREREYQVDEKESNLARMAQPARIKTLDEKEYPVRKKVNRPGSPLGIAESRLAQLGKRGYPVPEYRDNHQHHNRCSHPLLPMNEGNA